MTGAAYTLLFYLCTAPADGRQLACVAREASGASCAQAVAMVEAGIAADRVWFPAACVAMTSPPRAAPAGARRP